MAFHYYFPEKVAHPAQRIHCSCGSAMRLKSRCCLLLAGSKIFPLLPVSILIDSLLPSKLGLPLVVLHFVILRFSLLPFSDSRDPTLISDFNGSSRFCFGRPIWLVQLSLLEAPAVVRLRTPRPRISHSQSIFFLFYLPFLHFSFYL